MTYIVIFTFIKRYLKAKRARAPAYSRTLRLIKEGFPKWGSGETHVRCRNVEFQLSTRYTSAKWRIRIWSLSSQTFHNIHVGVRPTRADSSITSKAYFNKRKLICSIFSYITAPYKLWRLSINAENLSFFNLLMTLQYASRNNL